MRVGRALRPFSQVQACVRSLELSGGKGYSRADWLFGGFDPLAGELNRTRVRRFAFQNPQVCQRGFIVRRLRDQFMPSSGGLREVAFLSVNHAEKVARIRLVSVEAKRRLGL